FAAYNAGPARFDDYLLRGIPLPEETRRYLLSVNPQLLEAIDFEHSPRLAQRFDNASQTAAPPSGEAPFFPLGPVPAAPAGTTLSLHRAGNSAPDSIGRSLFSEGLFVPLTSPQGLAKRAGR